MRAERIERQFFIESRVFGGGSVVDVDASLVNAALSKSRHGDVDDDDGGKFRPDLVGDFLRKKRPGADSMNVRSFVKKLQVFIYKLKTALSSRFTSRTFFLIMVGSN